MNTRHSKGSSEGASERPTVLVTGASGYLAHRLLPAVAARGRLVAVSRTRPPALPPAPDAEWRQLDLNDRAAVDRLFDQTRPTAVIHAAAANPGSSTEQMARINVEATGWVAVAAARLHARTVHVSTDVVHSGSHAPYADDATPSPINRYGETKALGEAAVLAADPNAAVVRTSLIYGLTVMDRGTEGFVQRLRSGEALELFSDVVRQPVWVDALATALLALALQRIDVSGTLNVAGSQPIDRARFGRRLLQKWGVHDTEAVLDVSAGGHPDVPLDLRLDLSCAMALGLPLPGVDEVLARPREL